MRRPLEALAESGRAAEAVRDALEAVASGGVWAGRVSLRHRRGGLLATDVRCSPLQNAEDDTIGVILVAVDTAGSLGSDAAEATHVGRRIARGRKEAGLTQQELADRVGVTRRSIQGYEAGSIAPYRHLDELAAALGRRREWLVAEDPADDLPHGMPSELKTELRNLIREELAAVPRAEAN
jgi:transcriptional regulator with XRE-family HTH domain